MTVPLLEIHDLMVHFGGRWGLADRLLGRRPAALRALDGVSITVEEGAVLGLVGESGSGKSTLGRVVAGLERPTQGSVFFRGEVIAARGRPATPHPRSIQMIFQDPYSSLNPRMTIGAALAEPVHVHGLLPPAALGDAVRDMLIQVGLADDMGSRYPAELSGGQRQRVSLARALAVRPSLLVLDEPVSALDVSIQAQILQLLVDLRDRFGLGMVFIAHELGVVRAISTHIAVLYLGKIMEAGPTADVLDRPRHPYTEGLMHAAPRLGTGRRRRTPVLKGESPSPLAVPPGCRFHPRCPIAQSICRERAPPLVRVGVSHTSACHFAEPVGVSDWSSVQSR